jgi:hypothetical protein
MPARTLRGNYPEVDQATVLTSRGSAQMTMPQLAALRWRRTARDHWQQWPRSGSRAASPPPRFSGGAAQARRQGR